MAIYCMQCGKQHPDDANFCMGCGSPFKTGVQSPSMQWEYKNLVISLNDRRLGEKDTDASWIGKIVDSALQREGQAGWQAEGPTDLGSLSRGGLIHQTDRHNWNKTKILETIYHSVTIRMRRLSIK